MGRHRKRGHQETEAREDVSKKPIDHDRALQNYLLLSYIRADVRSLARPIRRPSNVVPNSSLQTSLGYRIKNPLIYARPSLVLCEAQGTLPLRVLQEAVFPGIHNATLVEESNGILIQTLSVVVSDSLECRENQIGPDAQKSFNANIAYFGLCASRVVSYYTNPFNGMMFAKARFIFVGFVDAD
jgi:hypothetical protein